MKKRRLIIRTIILFILGAAVAYTLYENLTKIINKKWRLVKQRLILRWSICKEINIVFLNIGDRVSS